MNKKNSVFIATSLDGFIADKNGRVDWLHSIPNPDNNDMGYVEFNNGIDALVMGRTTFETVIGFDVPWPYSKPVFVLSNKLKEIPESHKDKAFLVNGTLTEILEQIHGKGYGRLYIDGGTTIRNFLKEDWLFTASYTKLERFSAVDFLAQNDWARWDYSSSGSPDGRLTNLSGVELVAGHKIDKKINLKVKYYFVKQLIPFGIAKENGSRIRFDIDIKF